MNYWHIELYSGEIIKVKPDTEKIKYIQELISKQEGSITTPNRSIIIKDVRDFRESDEMYTDQKLLEDVNKIFKQPKLNKDNEVKARMVKKSVPTRRWYSHYSHIPGYRLLGESDSSVMIAFILPEHQIDHTIVQELSEDDERRLSTPA